MRVRPALAAALIIACGRQAPSPTVVPGAADVLSTAEIRSVLDAAAARYHDVAARLDPAAGYPRSTNTDANWRLTAINDWTSGFFPGSIWLLHAYNGDARLRAQAERWTLPLARIPRGVYSHDLGFQFNSSFGNGYRFSNDASWRTPALDAARLLALRFDPDVGAIRSWNPGATRWDFPVIVDNMMNLELLFWGARQPGGDARWRDIALQHARTTSAQHVRADGGSYHVVPFDSVSGRVLEKKTHQGYADESTWARGQAWLIYGMTMVFRESGERELLATARRAANYVVAQLPPDGVPCWDYQAPECVRDASAAAITAAALLELSSYVTAPEHTTYRNVAQRMLRTLASPLYRAAGQSFLTHAVGHKPAGTEVDVGIVYADYYFIEALLRELQLRGEMQLAVWPARTPRVFTARAELLRAAKERRTALQPALQRLTRAADSSLTAGPFSVTTKTRVPPSGDKHDYMSSAPYWWPDSTKPNGLPYVRRDGVVNEELRRDSDVLRWYAMVDAVETLARAWYFTDRLEYAHRAAVLLRVWFLDPATRMNPHLRYGQAIPGVTEGRGIGIIDTRGIGRLTDAIGLLEGSPAWTAADERRLHSWMRSYLDWLLTSEHGKDEADEANNHGTWYDVQVVALALFIGDTATARATAAQVKTRRIATQIDSLGQQPLELARTRSLHYSVENLDGYGWLAEMARHLGIDLWSDLRKAIDFVAPYADTARIWPHPQITAEAPDLFVLPLRRARVVYDDARYLEPLRALPAAVTRGHIAELLYPILPAQNDSLLGNARIAALPPEQQPQWQSYLAQSRQDRERDRAFINAELQPLGRAQPTPAPVGDGFEVERSMTAEWFRSADAKRMADAIVTYQTPTGGWSKRIDFARPRRPGESFASDDSWSWIGTLDNNSTTEQLKFLAAAFAAHRETGYANAFRRGVDYLLSAQFPNGCWPQIYPLQGGYHDAITFNDDASIHALQIVRGVARGDYDFLPAGLRARAQAALDRGIRCLLETQIVIAGRKLAWGAQHDPITLMPVRARAYEHASLSGRESATILDFLMQIEQPSTEVVAAVHAAAAWFRAAAISGYNYVPRGLLTPQAGAGPLWARFYELGSNRPIFSDRDGVVRYDLSEIGAERREGYLWYTDEPRSTLRRYDVWARNHPLSPAN